MSLLDVSLLGLLADQPMHGYELSKRLRELDRGTVSFGALYPALGRLDRQGLVWSADAPAESTAPMTGSLGAEVARLRRGITSSPGRSGRKRKVYTITESGRQHLYKWLVEDADDDRSFALRLAFAAQLGCTERLALFQRRRHDLNVRLAADAPGLLDRYRRALRERDRLADEAELTWLGELIEAERARHADETDVGEPADATSPVDASVDEIHQTVGGSPK